MKTFHLTIAKVGENLYDAEAVSATLPGVEGVFQVLADHEAFVSELRAGAVSVVSASGEHLSFPIPVKGIAEVSRNQATILL